MAAVEEQADKVDAKELQKMRAAADSNPTFKEVELETEKKITEYTSKAIVEKIKANMERVQPPAPEEKVEELKASEMPK